MEHEEMLRTFALNDPETLITQNRKAFYDEQIAISKKTGHPTVAVEVINVFIFTSDGELIIQKRSPEKRHNPSLLDKSVGGHVGHGDSADYTVMVETVQELQTPSIVLRTQEDFIKTHGILNNYLETISIIKHENSRIYEVEKIIDGEKLILANKAHIYFGVYDGRTRPVDKESKGVLYYTLSELESELVKFPDTFTAELHMLFKEFRGDMENFLKSIK